MTAATTTRVDWKLIFAQRGFRYFFVAMFVSLEGILKRNAGRCVRRSSWAGPPR